MKIIQEQSIAIISDLHCSKPRELGNTITTYLYSDALRDPVLHHPVESLKLLIKNNADLKTDLLLCPGDLTDKMDITGFNLGWSFLEEIARSLRCPEIIATIGNHDFDSRRMHKDLPEPNHIAKSLHAHFPFKQNTDKFWNQHYDIIERDEIIVLNLDSTFSHMTPILDSAGKFKGVNTFFDVDIIEKISNDLEKLDNEKFKVALIHHHPIQYSDYEIAYSDQDILKGGDVLLQKLGKAKFDILIHGHKHIPRFTVLDQLPVFCAGSFSSLMNLQESNSKNTFHILRLKLVENNQGLRMKLGDIRTWEFYKGKGWVKSIDFNSKIPPRIGFGFNLNVGELVVRVAEYLNSKSTLFMKIEELYPEFNELEYLPPQLEFDFFEQLKSVHRYSKSIKEDGVLILVKD